MSCRARARPIAGQAPKRVPGPSYSGQADIEPGWHLTPSAWLSGMYVGARGLPRHGALSTPLGMPILLTGWRSF